MFSFLRFLKEEETKAVVAHYGKWRIPHVGYSVVTDNMHEVAKKHNATQEVALSGASNPLTHEQKVKHAKTMFPNTPISSEHHTNFLDHAAALHKKGYTELHMVVGSDRKKEFEDKLNKYNGKPDKSGKVLFNFKKIHVHTAGEERSEGATGAAGSSSTQQEKHARAGDYKSFAANAPKGAKPEHVKALYNDVQKGLKESIDEGLWDTVKSAVTSFDKNVLEPVRRKGVEYNILSPNLLAKPEPQTVNTASKGDREQTVNRAAKSDREQYVNRAAKSDPIPTKPKVIQVSPGKDYVNPDLSVEKRASLEKLIAAKLKSMGK
jgi:hypothetical protein